MQHVALFFLYMTLVSAESTLASTCTNDPVLNESMPVRAPGLFNPHYDIVTARIVEVTDGEGATNGRPPTALLQVSAVLRGHIQPGVYGAVWQGAMRMSDQIDPDDYRSGVKQEWRECPLNTPPVGTDIIAFVRTGEGGSGLLVGETDVFRNTDYNRSVVSRKAVPAERQRNAHMLLFLALIAFPIIGIVLILTGSMRVGILFSVSEFPLYVYYESGISIYSNIRIDLLVVWPALVLALINVIIFMARYPRSKVAPGEGSIRDNIYPHQ